MRSTVRTLLVSSSAAILLVAMILLGSSSPPTLAGTGSNSVVQPYGTVLVLALPHSNALAWAAGFVPRKFVDENQLTQLKQILAQGGPVQYHFPIPLPRHRRKRHRPTPTATRTATPTAAPTRVATPTPTATAAPAPGSANFPGLQFSDSGGWVPPDASIAAGPAHLFEIINLEARVLTKSGTTVTSFSLNSFFKTSASLSDPKVLYDAASGRWFVSTVTVGSGQNSGSWNLAVSTGNEPTGRFNLYTFLTSSNFPDFPKFGLNSNKVILTGDAFGPNFQGTEFIVINKSELVAGTAVHTTLFPPDQGRFAIEPAQHLGSGPPPNDNLYMTAVSDASSSSVRVWAVSGVPSATTEATISTKTLTLKTTMVSPPNAQQKGTSTLVATNDNALLDAVYRDGSPGYLWTTGHDACIPSGDTAVRSCLRFIQIAISNGNLTTATLAQDFEYGSIGAYYYYPALRTDKFGDMAAAFTVSSSSLYPSMYAGAQFSNEQPGSFGHIEQIHGGDFPYTQSNRWGDYSGAGVDPADDLTIWLAGEYSTFGGAGSVYSTWIGDFVP